MSMIISSNDEVESVDRFFDREGKLIGFPRKIKKKKAILEHLLFNFERERRYTEQEVNNLLYDFYGDVATLRRALVDFGYMARERGVYWRVDGAGQE